MRSAPLLCRFARLLVVALGLTAAPSSAEAVSGLYIQAGVGVALYDGTQLIVKEEPNRETFPEFDSSQCCPPTSLATQFRLGYSIFGIGGPEFMFVGTGWDEFSGGGGFIGGGIRVYPLEVFDLAGLLDTEDFPFEITAGVSFGYTLIGEEFAYTGTFWDFDIGLDYKATSFMSIGARLDVLLPTLDDFVFTSFSNDTGRCLDGNGNQILNDGAPIVKREEANCDGRGPDTTVLSPQIVFTFHFNLF